MRMNVFIPIGIARKWYHILKDEHIELMSPNELRDLLVDGGMYCYSYDRVEDTDVMITLDAETFFRIEDAFEDD